jgi:hypothetical protein
VLKLERTGPIDGPQVAATLNQSWRSDGEWRDGRTDSGPNGNYVWHFGSGELDDGLSKRFDAEFLLMRVKLTMS